MFDGRPGVESSSAGSEITPLFFELQMASFSRWIRESAIVRIVAGFILAALALWALSWFVTGPFKQYPASFDSSIRYAFRQMQSPMWATLFLTFTKLGSFIYLTIVGCAAGLMFIAFRAYRPVLLLMVTMAGQAALHHGFKWIVGRPRPPALISYPATETSSFPSGHAIGALCLYFVIAWGLTGLLENPAIKATVWIIAAIIVLLVALSRIYIGIHYPTDVLAGLIAGLVWTGAVLSIDRRPL